MSDQHNPDSLTPEQVGVADGWRLLYANEFPQFEQVSNTEFWFNGGWKTGPHWRFDEWSTLRTKFTREELRAKLDTKTEPSQTTQKMIAQLLARDAKGLAKYGVTLDRDDLTPQQWASHAQEEMLYGAGYLERLIEELDAKDAEIERLKTALLRLCGQPDDPNNGWRGGSTNPDILSCEYCRHENFDCTQIEHAEDCPIGFARKALNPTNP